MKKYILLTLFGLAFNTISSAQTIDSAMIAELITQEALKITTVFEGEVIRIRLYAGDENGNELTESDMVWNGSTGTYRKLGDGGNAICYSITTFKVCQVYNNETLADTIQIVTSRRNVQFELSYDGSGNIVREIFFMPPTKGVFIPSMFFNSGMEGYTGVFFAYPHSYSGISSLIKMLSLIGHIDIHTTRWNPDSPDSSDKVFAGSSAVLYHFHPFFYTRQEMYDFLESIPLLNLDTHLTNVCIIESVTNGKKNSDAGEKASDQKPRIEYQQNLKNYNLWLERSQKQLNEIKQKSGDPKFKKAGENLILRIANPRLTGSNTQPWLEFDIMASSNVTTTFFDNCLIRMNYSTASFSQSKFVFERLSLASNPRFG